MAETKKRTSEAESQLHRAFARSHSPSAPSEQCPSRDLLERFASNRVVDQESHKLVLAHVSQCDSCLEIIFAKSKRTVQTRTFRAKLASISLWRRAGIAVAASFLIAALFWTWQLKQSTHSAPAVLVDLQLAAPTRGANVPVNVTSDTREVIIVLPESRGEGRYEIELRAIGNIRPVLRTVAATTVQGDSLRLIAALDFSNIAPGKYQLAMRRENSDWEYVPILRN